MYKTYISHAVSDENGHSRGGKPGDQTGREVRTQEWYNYNSAPWYCVFRAKSSKVREKIAATAEAIVAANVGYNQDRRTTLYNEAVKVGFDISKIKIPTETDCSAMVAVCCNAAGLKVSKDMYTGNERQALLDTGAFVVYDDPEHCTSSQKLKRGDILLKKGHTCIVTAQKYVIKRQIEYKPDKIMHGNDVKAIQKRLTGLKLFDKEVSGKYGKHTAAAVVRFQAAQKNLVCDGIVGKKTVEALGMYWGK